MFECPSKRKENVRCCSVFSPLRSLQLGCLYRKFSNVPPVVLFPRWHVNVPDTYTHRAESRATPDRTAPRMLTLLQLLADERMTKAKGGKKPKTHRSSERTAHETTASLASPLNARVCSCSTAGDTFVARGARTTQIHPLPLDRLRTSLPKQRGNIRETRERGHRYPNIPASP